MKWRRSYSEPKLITAPSPNLFFGLELLKRDRINSFIGVFVMLLI